MCHAASTRGIFLIGTGARQGGARHAGPAPRRGGGRVRASRVRASPPAAHCRIVVRSGAIVLRRPWSLPAARGAEPGRAWPRRTRCVGPSTSSCLPACLLPRPGPLLCPGSAASRGRRRRGRIADEPVLRRARWFIAAAGGQRTAPSARDPTRMAASRLPRLVCRRAGHAPQCPRAAVPSSSCVAARCQRSPDSFLAPGAFRPFRSREGPGWAGPGAGGAEVDAKEGRVPAPAADAALLAPSSSHPQARPSLPDAAREHGCESYPQPPHRAV